MSKDRSQKYPPLALPAKGGKAQGSLFLPAEWVGAYCIRPIIHLAKDRKVQGPLLLPVEWVGVYRIRPLIHLAKDGKAEGTLFPIRFG